ncbi:MAG: hypothetical protein OXE94_14945 [Aestuariivita sp.]|nr:hypothetical protein [Aestuariivita sp.]MCY4202691.1 hypothetical protein [Aestuariivita sp.]MCY4287289.1 hypothetical protein [Aestuariivita sp.]MCY4346522.1 hypothetical protein [Aestuariivita sp.]
MATRESSGGPRDRAVFLALTGRTAVTRFDALPVSYSAKYGLPNARQTRLCGLIGVTVDNEDGRTFED